MQSLQEAKIAVTSSQNIMLDDNTIRLSLFCPWLRQHIQSCYFSDTPHLLIDRYMVSYLPTPPLGQDMIQGQFLSGV